MSKNQYHQDAKDHLVDRLQPVVKESIGSTCLTG